MKDLKMFTKYKLMRSSNFQFVKTSHQIKLTDVLETLVECLNKDLNQIQDAELRFAAINTENKVESAAREIQSNDIA